ncbi:MAG: DUF5655 domain-containing protein [Candidatus Spyradocola sp.]
MDPLTALMKCRALAGQRKKAVACRFPQKKHKSPRCCAVSEPYPGRFTHHLRLESPEQADAELMGWLRRAAQWRRSR